MYNFAKLETLTNNYIFNNNLLETTSAPFQVKSGNSSSSSKFLRLIFLNFLFFCRRFFSYFSGLMIVEKKSYIGTWAILKVGITVTIITTTITIFSITTTATTIQLPLQYLVARRGLLLVISDLLLQLLYRVRNLTDQIRNTDLQLNETISVLIRVVQVIGLEPLRLVLSPLFAFSASLLLLF